MSLGVLAVNVHRNMRRAHHAVRTYQVDDQVEGHLVIHLVIHLVGH